MPSVSQLVRSVVGNDPAKPDELQEHFASTYFTLRLGIVVASLLLPMILYVAGNFRPDPGLLPSISHYYAYGSNFTRNWFVGTLCAVGTFLYLYKGYSTTENLVLNVAGVLAIVVALVPCRCGDPDESASVHGFAAVTFFLCIAFVCVRCSRDTLSLMPDEKVMNRFKRWYHLIGITMIVFPAIAVFISFVFRLSDQRTFLVEAAGIYTFAVYWLVKSRELSITQVERLVLKGKAAKVPGRGLVRVDENPSKM